MMKKLYILIAILSLCNLSYSQFKDRGSKFGIRYNQIYPENEFRNVGFGGNDDFSFRSYYFSFLVEALYAVEISAPLEVEFNLGIGKYAGDAYCNDVDRGDYSSTIIPFDIRAKLNPFQFKSWNPFLYAGAGVMHYISNTKPLGLNCDFDKKSGWSALFPVGLGSEFSISDNLLLEFSAGGTISTVYDLDGFKGRTEEIWDSYFNTSVGLLYVADNCNTDHDNDGLIKCDEEKIGTDPENPDTDSDGLNDGIEFGNYKTDPLNPDSDRDGLNDQEEIITLKTNPLIPDTDNDLINDYDEAKLYNTDPLNPDTDKDGLSDGDEIETYKTSPVLTDTDNDGLSDSQEVVAYKTNPNKKDTDNGTVDDYTEVKRNTNPLDPKDDVVKEEIKKFVFDGITFGFDKTNITKESEEKLAKTLDVLTTYLNINVEISGHTDNKGTKKYNMLLSERRAKSVKDWLVKHGVDPARLQTIGFGMDKPVAPNTSKENRKKNRRCDIKQVE